MDSILSLVMDGSPDDVNGFATALKDLAYFDILELIDPPYIHIKAGSINEDPNGEVLNLSDNVAQGFEDLSVSMDTNENDDESQDQLENSQDPDHHAMDENP